VAVVTCPKCPTTLRIPDGVYGNVKCPKCNELFPVTAPTIPAPKNAPASPQKPASVKPAVAQPAPAKLPPEEPDFEVVDEPTPKKKVMATIEDDEDDELPKRKKRDEDEDDDRPLKKKKPRRYEDDEDDDDWQPKRGNKKGHDKARIGMLLLTISSWLYFGLYVLFTLCVFLMLVGFLVASESSTSRTSSSSANPSDIASLVNILLMLLGLVGLGNWVVSLVGFSFCIAGPVRTRTKAITTTSLAGVHLVLVGLSYSITSNMLGGYGRLSGIESPSWLIFATTLPFLNSFLPALVYGARSVNGEFLVLILTGVFEVIRLIFSLLTIRSLADESKNESAAEKAQLGVVATGIIVGGGMILMLFIALLIVEAKFSNFKTPITVGLVALFLLCLAYTAMLLIPALTAGSTQRSLAKRNR